MKISYPFFHHVPVNSVAENLRWRRKVFKAVAKAPSLTADIRKACALDPLFYINTFGWLYDARITDRSTINPFVCYPYQVDGFKELVKSLGEYDLLAQKSRDMGASWMMLYAIDWAWRFCGMASYGLLSYKAELVDDTNNPKALFWKLDHISRNLPQWLMPDGFIHKQHRTKFNLVNPETGANIHGEATTENSTISDRLTVLLCDEFALTKEGDAIVSGSRDVTNCRWFNSTPRGIGNAYYRVSQTAIRKLTFHWSKHPEKSIGLYTTKKDGSLKIIDKKGYPKDYSPILDGKLRSPWYDLQCARATTAREIAQELDIDYLGSGAQFFDGDVLNELRDKNACAPFVVGELEYQLNNATPVGFAEQDRGNLKLWMLLDKNGNPPDGHYVLGCDISSGSGQSNSTLSAFKIETGAKVLEYANPYIRPEQFAFYATAVAKWLHNAIMIWENGGPGAPFGGQVIDLGYRAVYWKTAETSLSKKVSDIPGWGSNKDMKRALLSKYYAALQSGRCTNYSYASYDECMEYIHDNNGGVCHARAKEKDDPSGANQNHGDRVMADALGWKLVDEKHRIPKQKNDGRVVPYGSLKWRMEQRKKQQQKHGNRDLVEGWF